MECGVRVPSVYGDKSPQFPLNCGRPTSWQPAAQQESEGQEKVFLKPGHTLQDIVPKMVVVCLSLVLSIQDRGD